MSRCSGLLPRRPFVPQMIQVYFLEGSAVELCVSIVVLKFLSWRRETGDLFGLFAVHPEGLRLRSFGNAETLQNLKGGFWMLFGKTLRLFLRVFEFVVLASRPSVSVSVNVVVWFHSVISIVLSILYLLFQLVF